MSLSIMSATCTLAHGTLQHVETQDSHAQKTTLKNTHSHCKFFGFDAAEKHSQFWETRNYLANLSDKDHVPASLHMIGGWFDFFLPQQLIDLKQARENGCEARITIGPWHHWDVTKV